MEDAEGDVEKAAVDTLAKKKSYENTHRWDKM